MSQIIDIRPVPGEGIDRLVLAAFRGSEAQWTNVNELRKQCLLFFLSDLGSGCGEHRDVDGLIGELGMMLAHQQTVRVISMICGRGLPHTQH